MTQDTLAAGSAAPKIGFVSLGCPKALTDSELNLTQLRAEGYDTSKTFAGADLVIVNTCGFIDDAVKESLTRSARRSLRTARTSSPVVWARRQARAAATSCGRCTRACLPSPARMRRTR